MTRGDWVKGPPIESPVRDVVLAARNPWPGTRVSLEDWNPECDPAQLRIEAGAEVLTMPLEFHDGFERGGKYQGALILPAGERSLARFAWLLILLAGCQCQKPAQAVLLPIADRQWKDGAPDECWCGETSIQRVALHYGAWIPQPMINALGKPTHPDLWEEDLPIALENLGLKHERAQSKTVEEFTAWIIAELRLGHPVIVGAKVFPTSHPDWDVDHIMPVVGFTSKGLVFNTNEEQVQEADLLHGHSREHLPDLFDAARRKGAEVVLVPAVERSPAGRISAWDTLD